jgi:hypothetical protein
VAATAEQMDKRWQQQLSAIDGARASERRAGQVAARILAQRTRSPRPSLLLTAFQS